MKGTLRYLGEIPVHSLKLDWTPGMEITLEKVHQMFAHKSGSKQLDEDFVAWFHTNYMGRLGRDFELTFQDDELVDSADESPAQELAEVKPSRAGSVIVEASTIETAGSLTEARQKLRNMRHPDEVGEMDVQKHEETSTRRVSVPEGIKNQPKPGSQVMTGDDLEESNKYRGMVLSEEGVAKSATVINKERQQEDSAKMANLSRRASILTPDIINQDGSSSQVIVGEDLDPDAPKAEVKPGFKKAVVEGDSNRVNKNFKGYPTYNAAKDIRPEEIMSAITEQEARSLIDSCKDMTTLKVARIYAKDSGKQRLVEFIERRIRTLPPRS